VTTPSQARIAAILATAETWVSARRKSDNKPFFYVPGSTEGAVYMTAADGCTCPAAQNYSGLCKHSLAVRQHQERQTAATKPARRSYTAIFGDDDDKPFCTACNRHHNVGQHYVTVAA
jgi:hypothetical protein